MSPHGLEPLPTEHLSIPAVLLAPNAARTRSLGNRFLSKAGPFVKTREESAGSKGGSESCSRAEV